MPVLFGPNAQTDDAVSSSHSNSLTRISARTDPCSCLYSIFFYIASARPLSRGSAIIEILFFRFGVSAKQLTEDDSTTVSQIFTNGSLTLISISEYNFLRS